MDLQGLRQKLYLIALQQYRTAYDIAAAGPLRPQIAIVAVEGLAWIEALSVNDIRFLRSIRIAP